MKRSCDEYYQSGDEESGVRLIDPDGRGPRPPVYVYCRMGVTWGQDKTRRGVTVIHHNIRPDTPARSDSLPSHVKKVTYRCVTLTDRHTPELMQGGINHDAGFVQVLEVLEST